MAHGPVDLLHHWLSDLPAAARMAVAVDSDRLLADAGLLGKESLADGGGRVWRLAVFRGDDLAFRLAYRAARKHERVLVVLARGRAENSRVQVSYLADLLAANEGGPPLDVSLAAVFARACPKINFPVAELRRFKEELLANLEGVPGAAKKIIARFGRPDDWGTAEVAALVLLVRHADWNLDTIWPDETDAAAAIAHALGVALSVANDSPDLPVLRQLARGAARPGVQPQLFWLDQHLGELAAYLVLRKFAAEADLQNPALQLSGLQIFPPELPMGELEALSPAVIEHLRCDVELWRRVESRAEDYITPKRGKKLAGLMASQAGAGDLAGLSSPVLLLPVLERRLRDFFDDPATGLAWADSLASHPVLAATDAEATERERQCRAAARLARRLASIERRLAMSVPSFSRAEELLDWFVQSEHYTLELDVARTLHDREGLGDENLSAAAGGYLCGGDELSPAAGSLAARVWARLDELDAALGRFASSSPDSFSRGPKSYTSFIKEACGERIKSILTGDDERRVWVLIFDGMRYDSWREVVQPLLGEDFVISSEARFCTLPSYTLYARRSVLAGAPPAAWAVGKKPASYSEAELFANNIGLGAHERKEKLRFVTDAETTQARAALKSKDAARPFNVLIYPISDECHDYHGDLASFNAKIRQDLQGDRQTGVRGIIDDLLRRVRPGDIILATSDHGFIELPPSSAVEVAGAEAARHNVSPGEAVFYRYTKQFVPSGLSRAVTVEVGGEAHALCVGRAWLRREGVGTSVRYSHGGVSLAELVVPVAKLERVSEKVATVHLEGLPTVIAVDEDQEAEVSFTVANRGNVEIEFEVVARGSLDELLLREKGKLPPAGGAPLKIKLLGTFQGAAGGQVDRRGALTAVSLRVRHTDLSGKWREAVDGTVVIPIKVNAKKTKLTASALDVFEDV
ncbi:MAG TPA: PglZ domain-containing protein [Pirellulales bacterium]